MEAPKIYTTNNSYSYNIEATTAQDVDGFEEKMRELAQEVAELVISKQRDYGPTNILDAPYGPEVGITIRLWDKISRLKNLIKSNNEPKNETLDDTYTDIAGYALVALMVRRGWFSYPLKED